MTLQTLSSVDLTLVFTLIALAVTLSKIIEILVKRIIPKKNVLSKEEFDRIKSIDNNLNQVHTSVEDKVTLTDEQHNWLRTLHILHSKTDCDGIPLWYMPRSFIDAQKDIVEVLKDISMHHEKTLFLLESLIKRVEKVEDNQKNILAQTTLNNQNYRNSQNCSKKNE